MNPMAGMFEDLVFHALNRPKAIHALTLHADGARDDRGAAGMARRRCGRLP
jgi:hypothetical protein